MLEKIQKVSESLNVGNAYDVLTSADKKFNLSGWFSIAVVVVIVILVILGVTGGNY